MARAVAAPGRLPHWSTCAPPQEALTTPTPEGKAQRTEPSGGRAPASCAVPPREPTRRARTRAGTAPAARRPPGLGRLRGAQAPAPRYFHTSLPSEPRQKRLLRRSTHSRVVAAPFLDAARQVPGLGSFKLHVPQGRLSTHQHAGMLAYISLSMRMPFVACSSWCASPPTRKSCRHPFSVLHEPSTPTYCTQKCHSTIIAYTNGNLCQETVADTSTAPQNTP